MKWRGKKRWKVKRNLSSEVTILREWRRVKGRKVVLGPVREPEEMNDEEVVDPGKTCFIHLVC